MSDTSSPDSLPSWEAFRPTPEQTMAAAAHAAGFDEAETTRFLEWFGQGRLPEMNAHFTPPFAHIGQAIDYYRDTYADRWAENHPDRSLPRIIISRNALLEAINRCGYPLAEEEYALILSGERLPANAYAFLQAASWALGIAEESEEWNTLVVQLGYDILAKRMGTKYAAFFFDQEHGFPETGE